MNKGELIDAVAGSAGLSRADATKAVDDGTITAPTNWQVYDYHLQPGSPMKGLGLGPDDRTTTFSAQVLRFDGDGQPRYGAKCEIGPDEIEWDTDFPDSVWGVFEIEAGATVDFAHVSFENGSGVQLDGAAVGGAIENCHFFQHYGAGLDASGGTLDAITSASAIACWGPGIVGPNTSLSDVLAARNRDTGLTATSATDSQSDANWGHGFDLSGAAQNLTADDNTTEGIRALNGDMGLYYNDSDLGLSYSGLASWLDMSFNMKWAIHEDPSGDWHQEVRPHFGATVKQTVLGMTVKDTSRIEYREIQAHKDRWRYRNQIKAEMPWTVSPLELRPYIGDELWFYLDGTGFYANRVITGFKVPMSQRLTGDFYYYWNKATLDNRETWIELNVFGFKLHFSF